MAKSWRERDEQIMFSMTTGDGQTYFPEYLNPSYEVDMSTVAIEPNNIEGALVVSGKISFRKFDLRLIFQGEDHLDLTEKFMKSAKDVRPWIMFHPYYGRVQGRPTVIKVENSKLNVSELSIQFWESIQSKVRDTQISYTLVDVPVRQDIAKIQKVDKLSKWQTLVSAVAKAKSVTDSALADVQGAIRRADRFINNIGTYPQRYMAQVGFIARGLGMLVDTAINRIENIKASYYDVKAAFTGLSNIGNDIDRLLQSLSLQDKQSFEEVGSYSVQSLTLAATVSRKQAALEAGMNDIENEPEQSEESILRQISEIAGIYNDYVLTLGYMQSAKDCKLDSYYPNYETVKALENNILVSINMLHEKITGSEVKYSYTVPQSTALAPLVFRLTGNAEKDTIMKFIEQNKLTMNEVIAVPEGREVIYAR